MNMKFVTFLALMFGIIAVVGITSASDDTDAAIVNPSTGTQVGDLCYTFSGSEATVVGISSSLSSATSITIPDTVTSGGTTYNVTAIYSSTDYNEGVFMSLTSLESVTVSANLVSLGNYAFTYCTSLSQIVLPDSVEYIGVSAFYDCSNLALTDLPDGVTTLGVQAFYGCTNLALTDLPDKLTTIGAAAFRNCTALESLSIPLATTSIGNNAFNGCTNLSLSLDVSVTAGASTTTESWETGLSSGLPTYAVTLPTSLDGIPVDTWTYNGTDYSPGDSVTLTLADRSLTATLPKCGDDLIFSYDSETATLTITGTGAMYDYTAGSPAPWDSFKTSIQNLVIEDGATSIGGFAFYGCTALSSAELTEDITSIGVTAFSGCSSLALTELPSGLTTIKSNAFNGCTSLALTELPSGLTTIGYGVFNGCTSLALTELPDGVTTISDWAFNGCTSLALTELPSGLTTIGSNAFNGCTGLSGILVLPESVTYVIAQAFSGCTGYTAMVVEGSPTFGTDSLNMANVTEVLNLGDTELSAGSYGLPSTAVVSDHVPLSGYIAPVTLTITEEKEGAEYDLMKVIPIVVIAGILMASVVLFGLARRSDL